MWNTPRIVATALLVLTIALAACGPEEELSEASQKAFFSEFIKEGNAAEAQILAAHPDDEDRQAEEFRSQIEDIRGRLLSKHGIDREAAERILAAAHAKGW